MTLKYLITGVTGGLGEQVLAYFVANVPTSEFAAASTKESNRQRFEERGINFRRIDYDDPQTLETGLEDVENLLFVSTNVFDNERRKKQHANLVNAAKKANVKHVWYTSLAFGGLANDSKATIQVAHLETEKLLQESGLTYTSIREGAYTEAFPVFINWYPDTKTVTLPTDGKIAFTLRTELGEATARIMLRGGYENQIVLFTAEETITAKEVVDVINETTDRDVKYQLVSPEEYVEIAGTNDQGGKPKAFFRQVATWWESIAQGELEATDGLMREVLGRKPVGAREAVRKLLTENRDFTWHQNYVRV